MTTKTIRPDRDKQQKLNYTFALKAISDKGKITKKEFADIFDAFRRDYSRGSQRNLNRLKIEYGANSFEVVNYRAISYFWRKMGNISYFKYSRLTPENVALFGASDADRMNLSEKKLEQVLAEFEFIKDDETYLEEDGSLTKTKNGTDKSFDFRHYCKNIYVSAKMINGISGGGQNNELSEIHRFIKRTPLSEVEKVIFFCLGTHFTRRRKKEINEWIAEYCPNIAVAIYSYTSLKKHLKEINA